MSKKNELNISLCDGKYTIKQDDRGVLYSLRYGEPWRDLCGDNLVAALVFEIESLKEKINAAKNCLVCAAIADSLEVCGNTLNIFKYKREETQDEYDMRMFKKKDRERFERESDMRTLNSLLEKYNLALR